jgi:hypothetical protein
VDTASVSLDLAESYYVLPDGRWRTLAPLKNGRTYFSPDWPGNQHVLRSDAIGLSTIFGRLNLGIFAYQSLLMATDFVSDPSWETFAPFGVNTVAFGVGYLPSAPAVVLGPPLIGTQLLLAPEKVGPAMSRSVPGLGQGVGVLPGYLTGY